MWHMRVNYGIDGFIYVLWLKAAHLQHYFTNFEHKHIKYYSINAMVFLGGGGYTPPAPLKMLGSKVTSW